MKTRLFSTWMAAIALAAMPCSTLPAAEATDSAQMSISTTMTVDGKPATPAQKRLARQMARQGAQMAMKGTRMAMAAVTNPGRAQQLQDELEQMGDQMERLGDSLETLGEDTTFFYEGSDSDSVAVSEDWQELESDMEELAHEFQFLDSWWGRLLAGGAGITVGILAMIFAVLVCAFVFALLTCPIWLLALIIWLIVRGSRTKPTTTYQNPPINPAPDGGSSQDSGATATPHATNFRQAAYAQTPGYVQPYPDENTEMWKSGVMYCCIGVGLILVFLGIGLEDLWGIGALVACIGVAKLVIATTTKKKQQVPDSYEVVDDQPADRGNLQQQDYNKAEN